MLYLYIVKKYTKEYDMAAKRMKVFSVQVRFPLADGTTLLRHIAELGLTGKSAWNKVDKYYKNRPHEMVTVTSVDWSQVDYFCGDAERCGRM
jgi:hypothetical protein